MVNNLVFRWPKPLFFMVLGSLQQLRQLFISMTCRGFLGKPWGSILSESLQMMVLTCHKWKRIDSLLSVRGNQGTFHVISMHSTLMRLILKY